MVVSRKLGRKRTPDALTDEIEVFDKGFCRKCQKVKKLALDFFTSYSFLDTSGYLSVCKDCINEMYVTFFENEHTVERTVYRLCKILDIRYDEKAINAAIKHVENQKEKGKDLSDSFFGIYKMRLISVTSGQGLNDRGTTSDFSFQDTPIIVSSDMDGNDNDEEIEDLRTFWGTHLDSIDIAFLENELAKLKKTHKSDTYSEIVLAKEVCFKVLEIQKLRIEGKSVANPVKELQELMKSLSISPNQANALSEGKSMDVFGVWVKEIESLEPAEWYKDKKLFADVDNLKEYGEMYITRPLRNFITGSRDFTLEMENMVDEEEDGG